MERMEGLAPLPSLLVLVGGARSCESSWRGHLPQPSPGQDADAGERWRMYPWQPGPRGLNCEAPPRSTPQRPMPRWCAKSADPVAWARLQRSGRRVPGGLACDRDLLVLGRRGLGRPQRSAPHAGAPCANRSEGCGANGIGNPRSARLSFRAPLATVHRVVEHRSAQRWVTSLLRRSYTPPPPSLVSLRPGWWRAHSDSSAPRDMLLAKRIAVGSIDSADRYMLTLGVGVTVWVADEHAASRSAPQEIENMRRSVRRHYYTFHGAPSNRTVGQTGGRDGPRAPFLPLRP